MKDIAYPFLALVVIIGLILVSIKLFTDNISSLNSKLGDNTKQENLLQVKLSSLRSAGLTDTVSADSQAAIQALPASNPLLSIMANVQSEVQLLGLSLDSFSSTSVVTTADSGGVFSGDVTVDAEGGYKQTLALIENLKSYTPLIRFEGIKILNQGLLGVGSYKFTGDIFAYWAPLPTTLPAVSQSFEGLTDTEQAVLTKISALKAPSLSVLPQNATVATSSATAGRPDPFSP